MISFGFFSSSRAEDDLIIPKMCVERAHEIGVFENSRSLTSTRQRLSMSQAPWQVFEFKKMYESYASTLSKISTQMEDYKSPLFSYLQQCRKDEKTCHGYFQPTNPFHIQIFCDREILRSSIESIIRIKNSRFDKCTDQPFDEIPLADAMATGLDYDPKCFNIVQKDGIPYLLNKSHTQFNEIQWVDRWRKKMIDVTIETIQKSIIPEGVAFVLQKTIEEFDDINLRASKINDLNLFYRTGELIQEFETCCKNSNPMLPSGEISISYLENTVQSFHQSVSKPQFLTFQVKDNLSKLIFQEADRQYWRDFFKANPLSQLSETQQLSYFQYLQSDNLFPLEYERTFSDFLIQAKNKPRKEFKPKELTPDELKSYQEKLGYVYQAPRSKQLQDASLPRDKKLTFDYPALTFSYPGNQNQIVGNFLFNPDFHNLYIEKLENQVNTTKQKNFEEHQKIFYPRIFKSFLYYQFARTAQAKIIRELQKIPVQRTKKILDDFSSFYQWSTTLTCPGFEESFCTPSQTEFRKKKLKILYEKIITESIALEFSANSAMMENRKYIYSDRFLNSINLQIYNINKFCWEIADPKAFRNNPNSFHKKIQQLNQLVQDLYSIPRIEELLGQNQFLKTIKFDPSQYQYQCATKGYVFGSAGSLSTQGYQLGNQNMGYAVNGTIPVSPRINLYEQNIQKMFIPSKFQIKKNDIEVIEDEIEKLIHQEFSTLKKAYRYNEFSQYKTFLEESASIRLLAMIDFAIDHPSAQIGKYLCQIIGHADEHEYTSIQRQAMLVNMMLMTASVATVFLLPTIASSASVLYETGALIAFSTMGTAQSAYLIKSNNYKNNMVDMATLTNNLKPIDALQLHQNNNREIKNQWSSIIANAGLLVFLGARPMAQSAKYIRQLLDKEYQFVRKSRQLRVEEFLRRSTAEKNEFYITQKMEDFLFDYKKVSNSQFENFFSHFKRRHAESFIRRHWEKELGPYIPVKKIDPIPSELTRISQRIRSTLAPTLRKPYEWLAEKNSVFLQPYWIRIKPYYYQYFLNHFNSSLRNEERLVQMIEYAQALSKKTGREIFSKDEIQALASKIKSFRLAKDGSFYRIANNSLGKIIDRFMLRSVSGDSIAIRKYLEPLIHGELLKKEEWEIVLKSFRGQINSLDDCKSFLKTIKFAKMDYSSLWQQLKNAPELLKGKEIFRPYVFEKRANIILRNIDEFYDLSKYIRSRNNIRMVEDFRSFMISTRKTLDEIDFEVRKIYPDLSIKKMFQNYDAERSYVLRFKKNLGTDSQQNRIPQFQREMFKDEPKLLQTYKDQFLQQEKNFNAYFHKRLIRDLHHESDVGLAYQKALQRTQLRKSTEYECSLPDSKVRKETNRVYQQLAGKISLGTNFLGYMTVHGAKDKDAEWISRMAYEMAISYYGGILQAKLFTGSKILGKQGPSMISSKSPGGPINKITKDLTSGSVITAFDGLVYASVNKGLWSSKSQYQQEFSQIIYEATNVPQTVHEYFSSRPEIEERILNEYSKIKNEFDQLELMNAKGTMVDSDLEDAFVRAGLIDHILYSDMEQKNRELGKEYIYHDLIESGYVDPDLYRQSKTDEELEQQLFDLMADIRYQNLFTNKSGEIRYGFIDPIRFRDGDIDSLEIQTGSETTDRMAFYLAYDIVKTPIAYAKNNLVYQLLCNGRFLPGNLNVALALATHLVYKSTMDPLKFYFREQATGH